MAEKKSSLSRREFIRLTMMGAAGLALASCAPQSAPTTAVEEAPAEAPTEAPAEEAAEAAPTEAPAEAPAEEAAAPAGDLKEVARNRTFIAVRGGQQGKFVEYDQWNPFVPVANHQFAVGLLYEPLAFYSAFADKEYM